MNWTALEAVYKAHGVVLVLGAGVSMDSCFPGWSGLLARVAEGLGRGEIFSSDGGAVALPLPVVASILEEGCGSKAEFVRRIRKALYDDFPFFPDGVTKANRQSFVNEIQAKNPTLRTVASFCATQERGRRVYMPNPRVHAVVTFNLDALFQAYFDARYAEHLLRTVERASAQAIPGRLNVYHMHGFLRFDNKADDPAKENDAVVLTEQDYFDVFGSPTSFFNYTFLYLLRERPCVFIGSSMQDQNIRRLLYVSREERVRGLENEGRKPDDARRETLRHFAILKRTANLRLDEAFEESLRRLGTSVLWVNAHPELQSRLQKVYEAADSDWNLVY